MTSKVTGNRPSAYPVVTERDDPEPAMLKPIRAYVACLLSLAAHHVVEMRKSRCAFVVTGPYFGAKRFARNVGAARGINQKSRGPSLLCAFAIFSENIAALVSSNSTAVALMPS